MTKRRKVAVLDFETTGLSDRRDRVREIGVVIAYADNFEYIEHWKRDIAPKESPKEAFRQLNEVMFGCTVITYNSAFDSGFLKHNLEFAGLKSDYHILCAMSMAVMYLRQQNIQASKSLESMCRHFGIAVEPKPHKAIYGALAAHAVLKKIFAIENAAQQEVKKHNLQLVA